MKTAHPTQNRITTIQGEYGKLSQSLDTYITLAYAIIYYVINREKHIQIKPIRHLTSKIHRVKILYFYKLKANIVIN